MKIIDGEGAVMGLFAILAPPVLADTYEYLQGLVGKS